MKKILVTCALFANLIGFSQSEIEYIYDNAGNRIQRRVYQLPNGLITQNNSTQEKEPSLESTNAEQESGIADLQGEHSFKLFPNPIKSEVNVEMSESFLALDAKKIYLFDMKGVELLSRAVNNAVEKIDFSNLPQGSYIVKVSSESVSQEWRVVKE